METKFLAIIVAAVVVAAGAGAGFAIYNNNNKGTDTVKVTGNLPVFGNSNNDDFIDARDIDTINSIIADTNGWDKDKYPYADADQDGSITQKDIDLVQNIIDRKDCDVWYVNFEGEPVKQSFPVNAGRICVNRYFFAEIVDILGLFDHIVLAPTKLTQDRSHMYDMSKIETAYEGGKAPTAELILDNDIDLIIADSWDGDVCKTAQAGDPSISAFYVDIYSYGNLVRYVQILGLLTGTVDKAASYAGFVNGINDYIKNGMEGVEKKRIAITYLGTSIAAGNTTIECAPCSSTYLLDALGTCYYSDEKSSRNNRLTVTDEWMLQNYKVSYDAVVAMHEYTDTTKVGDTYYSPASFNERCDQLDGKYSALTIKAEGNLHSTSFFSITFGSYAHIPMIAHMLYPEIFSEEKGWDYLQEYWDNYSSAKIDVRTQGGWFDTRA